MLCLFQKVMVIIKTITFYFLGKCIKIVVYKSVLKKALMQDKYFREKLIIFDLTLYFANVIML